MTVLDVLLIGIVRDKTSQRQSFILNFDNLVIVPEFLEGVSQFSGRGDKESKLKFTFQVYDMNRDGFISNGELFTVLKMMVGNNLKEVQLQQIVDKTILQFDRDGDGMISYEEFAYVSSSHRTGVLGKNSEP